MRIDTEPGEKVVFNRPTSGQVYDQILGDKYLKENEEYTVATLEVHPFISYVTLKELPGIEFNTVLFSSIAEAD